MEKLPDAIEGQLADLALVLCASQRIEQPLPLAHAGGVLAISTSCSWRSICVPLRPHSVSVSTRLQDAVS